MEINVIKDKGEKNNIECILLAINFQFIKENSN